METIVPVVNAAYLICAKFHVLATHNVQTIRHASMAFASLVVEQAKIVQMSKLVSTTNVKIPAWLKEFVDLMPSAVALTTLQNADVLKDLSEIHLPNKGAYAYPSLVHLLTSVLPDIIVFLAFARCPAPNLLNALLGSVV